MTRGIGQRFQRTSRVRTYSERITGQVALDIMNVGHGELFKQILGGVVTTHPATEYVHTFTPDAAGKLGVSGTWQVGRPDVGGTVRAFTYAGCKVLEGTIDVEVGQNAKLTLTVDGTSEVTATALATASYPASAVPLSFIDGALTIDAVRDQHQEGERQHQGRAGRRPPLRRQHPQGADRERRDGDHRAARPGIRVADRVREVRRGHGERPGAHPLLRRHGRGRALQADRHHPVSLKYTGETPSVGSSEIVQQPLPFKALYDGTNPIITIAYTTTDALP
jgi:hypothetical protein